MASQLPRVLIVDDDDRIRDLLSLALEGEGYEARGAANGRDALSVLDIWRADLIVLDLVMPDMDGPAFLNDRQRVHAFPDVPVLIVSGLDDLAKRAEGLTALAVYQKPLGLDDFLDAVRSLTRQSPRA